MTDSLEIVKLNEAYVRILCPDWMAAELSDHFAFKAKNYKFHPKYKAKIWDGTIRLFNAYTRTLYAGLIPAVESFATSRNYSVTYSEPMGDQEVSELDIDEFIAKLKKKNFWPKFELAEDQRKAITACFRKKRVSMLSPTGSGKSFLIYLNCWWFRRKTLIVVPRIGLATQMAKDLISYGMPEEYIHIVTSGEEKTSTKPIVISTWQSIYKQPASYFAQYTMLIGDEVHGFKATALMGIATKCVNADVRIGLTGTFDDSQTDIMTVKGLFGDLYRASTTAELQAAGRLSKLEVKCIVLTHHPDDAAKLKKSHTYPEEIEYLINNGPRNKFITNLACSLKGVTLLLFRRTDQHAKVVYDMIKDKAKVPVYYIDGKVDKDDREEIRMDVIEGDDAIIVASYGTTSTGVNIPNIRNLIFGSPTKSKITVLQSIGRALRMAENKDTAVLFDIADNLGKTESYSIIHMKERVQLYAAEQFVYKLYNVTLKKDE